MKNRRILGIVVGVLVVAIVAFVAVGLIFENSLPGRLFRGTAAGGAGQPTYSSAVVDGNIGEWDLANDQFAPMYRAGKIGNPIEAYLYLRYDCDTDTMYALVYSDYPVDQIESEAWIALGSRASKVSFSQFAWTPDGQGWEAAFPLAEGSYSLWAHTNVNHDGEWQTAEAPEASLTVQCYTPTAVDLKGFVAIQGDRGIMVRWETVAEVDNIGFNLYYSTGKEGPWTKLNRELIPSKVPPGSGEGAVYQFGHAAADLRGDNFYLLEDIDVGGAATQHGPITP
jgi:hypothetical protein